MERKHIGFKEYSPRYRYPEYMDWARFELPPQGGRPKTRTPDGSLLFITDYMTL